MPRATTEDKVNHPAKVKAGQNSQKCTASKSPTSSENIAQYKAIKWCQMSGRYQSQTLRNA